MIPSQLLPFANHLWQSTWFAAAASLLALFLRKNRAHVRYWLWLSASVKFLVPFSILVDLGSLLGRHTHAVIAPTPLVPAAGLSFAMEQVGEPFTRPVTQATSYADVIVPALIAVWAIGFASLVCRWALRWWRMRASMRKASMLNLSIGLPVRTSPAFGEPGVFGIFQPTLLLPEGIADCLTTQELDSIVTHELCHVRRRDNLTTAIHMAVESLFWFHPLVWWLGARLMEERERACDEEVLRTGGDPHVYAEGILKICELYLASPLACVAGVTGGDLKKRIEAIVGNRETLKLNFGRKAFLAIAALAAIAMPIAVGIVNAATIHADQTSTRPGTGLPQPSPTLRDIVGMMNAATIKPRTNVPGAGDRAGATPIQTAQLAMAQAQDAPSPSQAHLEFDAASIRPVEPVGRTGPVDFGPGRVSSLPGNSVTAYRMILAAYDLREYQLTGKPAWLNVDRFALEAKAANASASIGDLRAMLQNMLIGRLSLAVHRETKEMDVYALVQGKNGTKLRHWNPGDPMVPIDKSEDSIAGVSGPQAFEQFVELMNFPNNPMGIDKPVIDETGLNGTYFFSWQLHSWDDYKTEVIEDQLGLKLESRKMPVDIIVIDHVEKPSEN